MPSYLQQQRAALVAMLIDDEVAWIIGRLPPEKQRKPFHRAVLKEAERRGLRQAEA